MRDGPRPSRTERNEENSLLECQVLDPFIKLVDAPILDRLQIRIEVKHVIQRTKHSYVINLDWLLEQNRLATRAATKCAIFWCIAARTILRVSL